MAPDYYGQTYSSWEVPTLTANDICRMMDKVNLFPSLTSYSEIYKDFNTGAIKTKQQDYEIRQLKKKLEDKEVEKKMRLDNLIAYYYKR